MVSSGGGFMQPSALLGSGRLNHFHHCFLFFLLPDAFFLRFGGRASTPDCIYTYFDADAFQPYFFFLLGWVVVLYERL
jgi:hypothetical protein